MRRTSARGAALVELVMVAPVLIAMLVGTADFGRAFYATQAITHAARAGAEWAAQSTSNASNSSGITSIVQGSISDGAWSDATITVPTPVNSCACVTNTPASATDVDATEGACPATCSGSTHQVNYISVTVTKTFTTISIYPGIPHTLNISRTMKMRVQ
jgi:Flp pilus assembly protein TadG